MTTNIANQTHRRLAATKIVVPTGVISAGSRGEILNAALQLFAERGYGATSIRDIAAVVGLNAATLYGHFPSKEHVLAEIIKIGHDEHFRCIRAAVLDSEGNPEQQIAALVRAHVRFHVDFTMLAVVANSELHALSSESAAPSLELRKQIQQLLQDVIQRGIDRGLFNVSDPWLAMMAIGGMGLRVAHWYTPEVGKSPDQVADAYAEFALKILKVPDSSGT